MLPLCGQAFKNRAKQNSPATTLLKASRLAVFLQCALILEACARPAAVCYAVISGIAGASTALNGRAKQLSHHTWRECEFLQESSVQGYALLDRVCGLAAAMKNWR